jgi:hypothetical protein
MLYLEMAISNYSKYGYNTNIILQNLNLYKFFGLAFYNEDKIILIIYKDDIENINSEQINIKIRKMSSEIYMSIIINKKITISNLIIKINNILNERFYLLYENKKIEIEDFEKNINDFFC